MVVRTSRQSDNEEPEAEASDPAKLNDNKHRRLGLGGKLETDTSAATGKGAPARAASGEGRRSPMRTPRVPPAVEAPSVGFSEGLAPESPVSQDLSAHQTSPPALIPSVGQSPTNQYPIDLAPTSQLPVNQVPPSQDSATRPQRPTMVSGTALGAGSLPAAAPPSNQLQAELRAMRQVQRALSQNQGGHALELLQAIGQHFAGGALRQERAAERVQALCMQGQANLARKQAEVFTKQWPRSPLRAKVEKTCR